MASSPRNSGSTVVLILLLLAVCYFADWTDDYFSYCNAARYSSFGSANGRKPTVSGGAMNNSATMAVGFRSQPSALEAVFGSPSPNPSGDDASSSRTLASRMDGSSAIGASADSSYGFSSGNRMGLSSSRSGLGFSGSNSGFGLSGLSGSSGLGAATMSGYPK